MMKNFLFYFSLLLIAINANAQDEERGITLVASYEMPLHGFHCTFDPAPGFSVHFTKWRENTTIGGNIGFQLFKPKEEIFYYLYGANEYGTASFGKYGIIPLMFEYAYHKRFTENIALNAGAEIGLYYTWHHYNFQDPDQHLEGDAIEGKGALSPRAILEFMIDEQFSVTVRSKYNFILGAQELGMVANQTITTTFSNGLGLSYKF